MMKKDYYTVKEIADLVKVSKTTIQKIIKSIGIDFDYVERNRQYYSFDKAKRIILDFNPEFEFPIIENQSANQSENSETETENNKNVCENSQTKSAKSETKTENSKTEAEDQIAALNRMLDIIQKQLEEKDRQLSIKDKQIADLSERLKEAMLLTKGQQYIAAADKATELIEAAADPEQKTNSLDPDLPPKKKSFWERWFSRS